ncbi:hypothetical protein [Deinococcus marmoris]|uniref:Uncharacterized protein n=1 Tax=Deinococcus marmoris TaxID=249408 RepID=A0A1U7P4P4_9DEIO|nr:hypothetical protein [Deinococcus marmoris]OLV20130.1 hypothetical protein BOO71_0000418 [Deinococcus marmoris]
MSSFPVSIPDIAEDFDTVTVRVGRILTEAEVAQVGGCLGYALRVHVAGEDLGDPESVAYQGGQTIIRYFFDSTKAQRSDPDPQHAFQVAAEFIFDGTPIRSSNRSGPNTAGTRLIQGIGPVALAFSVNEYPEPTPPAAPALPDPSELLAAHQAMLNAQARYAQAVSDFRGHA